MSVYCLIGSRGGLFSSFVYAGAMPTGHDEDLSRAVRSCMFPESSFASGPGEVASCLRLAMTPRGSAVLDLACGPGRHTLPLARAGYRVVSVDHSSSYLNELQQRLEAEQSMRTKTLQAELVLCDMREFLRPDSFDLALSLYHSLGHFREEEDNRRVLRVLHDSLRLGGSAVVQLVGVETLRKGFQAHISVTLDDGTQLIQRRAPSEDWSWMEVSWTFVHGGMSRSFDLSHRVYSAEELRNELLAAGFGAVSLYGGFDGRAYESTSEKLVAVARRGGEPG